MRNQLISLVFTAAILSQLFLNYPQKVLVSALLCVGCFFYFFRIQKSILQSSPANSISAKRIRKRPSAFILLVFLIILSFSLAKGDANRWVLLFSIASISAIELISFFQYRNQQPATLFIKGDKILLEDIIPTRRDLSSLESLLYNPSTETITLHFRQQNPMHLVLTEFDEEGLRNILSHAVLRTGTPVWTDERIKFLIRDPR